jgi:predicted nucleotidyltransferase
MNLQNLREKREQILKLAGEYRTENVRIFGSVARGDNTEKSDVDLLIRTQPGCSLLDLGGFLEDLRDLLGCPVDIVTEDGLKERFRQRILGEAVLL